MAEAIAARMSAVCGCVLVVFGIERTLRVSRVKKDFTMGEKESEEERK